MRKELQHIELIEKYLMGVLSPAEKIAFEEGMHASPLLQQEVLLQQQVMERIQLNAFAADVKMFHDEKTGGKAWWKRSIYLNSLLLVLLTTSAAWAGYKYGFSDEQKHVVKSEEIKKPVSTVAVTTSKPDVKTEMAALPEETKCNNTNNNKHVDRKKDEVITTTQEKEKPENDTPGDTNTVKTNNHETNLADFYVPYITKSINPAKDNHIFMKGSGSVIHIPANALVYKDGTPVKGSVRIKYREFRHAGEMAFSNIPMMYHEGGKEYMFSSAGMFELRGWQGNKEIYIKRGGNVTVDFRMNYANDSLHFFALNDKTNEWKMQPDVLRAENDSINNLVVNDADFAVKGKLREKRFMDFLHRLFFRKKNVPFVPMNRQDGDGFTVADTIQHERKTGTRSTLLGDGTMKDKGHTYPALVKGLNCPEFGVYNCDQIHRLADKIHIHATYTDENGKEIKSQNILSMVDMRYNGAFSFDPANFTCSKSGRNVLLLFTNNNKLYALRENEWKAMNIKGSGDFTFKMKDISAEVKTPNQLKVYLGMK